MPLDTASEERLTLVLSAQGGSHDDDCCARRGDMSCADGYTLHDTGNVCYEWWDWVRIMLSCFPTTFSAELRLHRGCTTLTTTNATTRTRQREAVSTTRVSADRKDVWTRSQAKRRPQAMVGGAGWIVGPAAKAATAPKFRATSPRSAGHFSLLPCGCCHHVVINPSGATAGACHLPLHQRGPLHCLGSTSALAPCFSAARSKPDSNQCVTRRACAPSLSAPSAPRTSTVSAPSALVRVTGSLLSRSVYC